MSPLWSFPFTSLSNCSDVESTLVGGPIWLAYRGVFLKTPGSRGFLRAEDGRINKNQEAQGARKDKLYF